MTVNSADSLVAPFAPAVAAEDPGRFGGFSAEFKHCLLAGRRRSDCQLELFHGTDPRVAANMHGS